MENQPSIPDPPVFYKPKPQRPPRIRTEHIGHPISHFSDDDNHTLSQKFIQPPPRSAPLPARTKHTKSPDEHPSPRSAPSTRAPTPPFLGIPIEGSPRIPWYTQFNPATIRAADPNTIDADSPRIFWPPGINPGLHITFNWISSKIFDFCCMVYQRARRALVGPRA
ncbi:hypothetical protein M408DRAFT_31074 [Serendipita vermifera MAFF 305830]|uniref:Uncharacterized protein n=1 Tax=Serendipita vermifera MAFF 305830 TaxID=933852 RepID=A0A0C3A4N5_SERVB|nr:hypothetical protein M408DRAFT_31074 [Serendipita vermifera MAFF 305830]